jgi:hypothetical protein
VTEIFDLLEEGRRATGIESFTGVPARTVQRLGQLKLHMETAGPGDPWPAGLLKAWPRTINQYASWYRGWVDARDNPLVTARRDHVETLVNVAGKVRTGLQVPAWINRLGDPRYWAPPLVPAKVSEPPQFGFEKAPEFADLVAHMPAIGRRLEAVHARLRDHADRFEALTVAAATMLDEKLPGLSEADPQHAVRDAAIVEAINQDQYPAPTSNVAPESDPVSGTMTVRVLGRAAPGLPPEMAERVKKSFAAVVKGVLDCAAMKHWAASRDSLNQAVDSARELVRSDSVTRKAIVHGLCSSCPGNHRAKPSGLTAR